jgi:hypothetical protein
MATIILSILVLFSDRARSCVLIASVGNVMIAEWVPGWRKFGKTDLERRDGWMIDELERLEGSCRGQIDVLSQHLTRETEQNHENLRMAGVSSRIPP